MNNFSVSTESETGAASSNKRRRKVFTGTVNTLPRHNAKKEENEEFDYYYIKHLTLYKVLGYALLIAVFAQPACFMSMLLVLSESDKCLDIGIFMVINGLSCFLTAILFCVMTFKPRSRRSLFAKSTFVSSIVSLLTNLATCIYSAILLWDIYFNGEVHFSWEEPLSHVVNLTQFMVNAKNKVKLPPPEIHVIILVVLIILFIMTFIIVSILTYKLGQELRTYKPKTSRSPSLHSSHLLLQSISSGSSNGWPNNFGSPRYGITQRTLAPLAHPSFFYEGSELPENVLSDEGVDFPVLITYTTLPD